MCLYLDYSIHISNLFMVDFHQKSTNLLIRLSKDIFFKNFCLDSYMHFTQSIDWIKEIKSDFLLQLIYIVTVG